MSVVGQTLKFYAENNISAKDSKAIHDPKNLYRRSKYIMRDIKEMQDTLTDDDLEQIISLEKSGLNRGCITQAAQTILNKRHIERVREKRRMLDATKKEQQAKEKQEQQEEDDAFWLKKAEELGIDLTFSSPELFDRLVIAWNGLKTDRTFAEPTEKR